MQLMHLPLLILCWVTALWYRHFCNANSSLSYCCARQFYNILPFGKNEAILMPNFYSAPQPYSLINFAVL